MMLTFCKRGFDTTACHSWRESSKRLILGSYATRNMSLHEYMPNKPSNDNTHLRQYLVKRADGG